MPKVTAKPDYTEAQFQRELKRYGFEEVTPRLLNGRTFRVGDNDAVPGVYFGLLGAFNARLTLKHLQSVKALQSVPAKTAAASVDAATKKKSGKRSTERRAVSGAASSEADPKLPFVADGDRANARMGEALSEPRQHLT